MTSIVILASVVNCYVGCGGGSPDRQALHVLACDTETGAAKIVQSVKGVQGTNYGAIDANGRYLYSYVSEERAGAKASAIVRFPLQNDGRLGAQERVVGLPSRTPCHVALSPNGQFCSFAEYGQGVSGVFSLADLWKCRTRGVTPPVSANTLLDDAMGPDRKRQEKAHAHCTFYTPDSKLMGVIDLGCDRIVFFRLEPTCCSPAFTLKLDPGDGPRHAVWSKDNRFLFVINELGNSVTSFAYDGTSFSRVGKWTTLPPDFKSSAPFTGGMSAPKASAVKLTADGKLLMASNRGYDSIAFFDVDTETGTLKYRRDAKLGGSFPRDFELLPGEKFMVVGYELSNKIEICRFDRAACTLEPVGEPITAWKPIYFGVRPDRADAALQKFVSGNVLPFGGVAASTSAVVDREIDALDAAADEAWCALKTKADYDAYRLDLRRKMLAACGTFPDRTPLNARTVATLKRDGYTVEKVIFESMPGLLVTANLFIPDGLGRRPTVVMSCGHADDGKDCNTYLRACVVAVKRGFVALMFDPYNQGERKWQGQLGSCNSHTQMGLRGNLLDWSAPLLRIWDGMRAIDYALTRPEVDASRLGYMGQSGGGTMTALMEAADDRIKAACPSCYLTSLRALCQLMGPQDGEQNIYGQLSFGLNHTGYVLIPDIPIAVTCKFGDMFPYFGVRTLFKTVKTLERNVGLGDRAFLNCAPGPHGWTEATENSSVQFLAKQFIPECRDLQISREDCWLLDQGYDIKTVDVGLAEAERGCTPERSTEKAGSRHIHDIIADRFAAAEPQRQALDLTAKRALATRLAKVKTPAETGYRAKETYAGKVGAYEVAKVVVQYPKTGALVPAVCVAKPGAAGDPVLVAAYGGRAAGLKLAMPYVDAGRPAMIADVSGVGEVGKEMYIFYGAKTRPDEGLGAMCYLLGTPLVGRRATDLLVLSEVLAKRCGGRKPLLVAAGPLAIPAAHAVAADAAAWSGVALVEKPRSWFEILKAGSQLKDGLYYADLVPGAALGYDWTELVGESRAN